MSTGTESIVLDLCLGKYVGFQDPVLKQKQVSGISPENDVDFQDYLLKNALLQDSVLKNGLIFRSQS